MKKRGINRRQFLQYGTAIAAAGFARGSKSKAVGLASSGEAESSDTRIVRAAIHPGIGVARIGNSEEPEGFFIGPEVVEPAKTSAGQSRDSRGALKRQAARFRIYGYNAAGEVVRELTADDAEIEWSAHLANKKASWYRFIVAMDLPEARDVRLSRRNSEVAGNRSSLVIDAGARSIQGKNQKGVAFDQGRFMGLPVKLGELRTDDSGRLLVLSGLGKSESPNARPPFIPSDKGSFNNADGWYDDIADGPVRATVRLGTEEIPCDSAWVVTAPPNYAPDMIGWRTLYDLLVDTYVEAGMLPIPQTTSFTRDVLPIFRRLSRLQWVNKGFADLYGHGTLSDFDDPNLIAIFADKKQSGLHRKLFDSFRHNSFSSPVLDPKEDRRWPLIYGDAFGSFDTSPSRFLGVGGLRALHLKRWSEGNFVNDWNPTAAPEPLVIAEYPVREQAAMLDRAALHFCLADAFHPGCELTWPMRHASLYRAPFRIKEATSSPLSWESKLGTQVDSVALLADGGPLFEQSAGDLTKWMALPWQGDTVFCRSGYEEDFDPYLPTFWPARVPNHVLSEEEYTQVMDTSLPREERKAAFLKRVPWTRAMTGAAPRQMQQMVRGFGKMGIVEARAGFENDADFPRVIYVESLATEGVGRSTPSGPSKSFSLPSPGIESVRAAPTDAVLGGWENEAQRQEFLNLKRGNR